MDDLAERKERNGYQAENKETKNGRTSRNL